MQTQDTASMESISMKKEDEDLIKDVKNICLAHGMVEHEDNIREGALAARYGMKLHHHEKLSLDAIEDALHEVKANCPRMSKNNLEALRKEANHRWSQPFWMYFLAALCAASAIVQGMDQSAVNGAQRYYFEQFGVTDLKMKGFVNGAPYIFAAVIGCWLTRPLNNWFGRRGCISLCCFATALASIWQAASPSLTCLIVSRAFLGLGIGAKSTTTPVYASECAPTKIRGALAMMWQMWTAFGIMLGFATSLAYAGVSNPNLPGLNWRLMLGTNAFFPSFVCALVWLCPESPRWYMRKGRHMDAYKSLCKLRSTELLAARDFYAIYKALQREDLEAGGKRKGILDLFKTARNRRAAASSFFVMFMQQFCGVNVVAYYSTEIFVSAGQSMNTALLVSFGTGVVNWLFALPAIYTIDTFGRRNLLLISFPLMGICLLVTGSAFYITDAVTRLGVVASGLYMFMVFYSPGEGPVPFTYSAEAFPMDIRDWGMSFATSVCWLFNFILAFTWPQLMEAFTPAGAFYYYAAWCFGAFVYTWFFLQETKGRSLEQLDIVFGLSLKDHARYHWEKLLWYARRCCAPSKEIEPFKDLFTDAKATEDIKNKD